MVDKLWHTFPCAIMWSLWKARNEHKFQGSTVSREDLQGLIKVRLALWAKYKVTNFNFAVNDLVFRLTSINGG